MYCPRCGILLHLDEQSKRIDNAITDNKEAELFVYKGCGFRRSEAWWESLQLDVNTEIDWGKAEEEKLIKEDADELPEELAGYCESPWGD